MPKIIVSLISLAVVGLVWTVFDQRGNVAEAAGEAMLQAMERGYNCRAAGRALDDCKNEQRQRWSNPKSHGTPFGAVPAELPPAAG